ncbi:MAG: sulfatase-like hydrolase/transferase [Chloroflexi bacterium]|nr:sulfatase-like hydrolase/transferase [Chloroflexota bacterium]
MLTRREFLKLTGLLPLVYAGAHWLGPRRAAAANSPNILILLFDTFTAQNLSLHGYARRTTPNLERLAERAIVYHQHYAGGNFTTPATASLLTGMYPWTHRAIRLFDRVNPALARRNMFAAFDDYHRVAYAQNPVANTLLVQFMRDLDEYLPLHKGVPWRDVLFTRLFSRDHIIATAARNLSLRGEFERSASLFLSPLYNRVWRAKEKRLRRDNGDEFPLGLPTLDEENHMTLDGNVDFLLEQVAGLPHPYLAYFHFFPPHGPYRPTAAHVQRFDGDGFEPPRKPLHPLKMESNAGRFEVERRWYDAYLSNLDEQIGRLFQLLEQRGLLQNTILLLTADHGEMFERGIIKHFHKSLHQPVVHIPLLVFLPGQSERLDILSPTSAVDVLPTLLHLAGKPPAPWAEGCTLRPFRSGPADAERPFYALEAKESHPARPLGMSSAMLVRWPYKLTHYYGYRELEVADGRLTELFNLEQDPEELDNLAPQMPDLANELLANLLGRMEQADAPYRS